MKERTFTLSKVFTEIFFERFSQTLEHLKSGDGSYSEATGKLVEPYTKVTVEDIAAFIESAFWASVTAEEGRYHGFHVSLGPPNEYPGQYSWDYLFSLPRAYSPREISALAPVLAKNYKRVGVWYSSSGSLEIWGIADVAYWPVEISTSGPGQLLFSMLGGVNSFDVAISGSWWGFVDKRRVPITLAYLGGTRPDNPLELDPETVSKALRRSRAYESIAKSMLQHGHGGTLIIVPEDHETWRRSLASIKYEGSVFQKIRGDVDEWDTALHREQESGRFMHDGDTERARQSA